MFQRWTTSHHDHYEQVEDGIDENRPKAKDEYDHLGIFVANGVRRLRARHQNQGSGSWNEIKTNKDPLPSICFIISK